MSSEVNSLLLPTLRAWYKFSHIQYTEELASNTALKSQLRVFNPLLRINNQEAQKACEHFGKRQRLDIWVANGHFFLQNFRHGVLNSLNFLRSHPLVSRLSCPILG